MRQFHRKDEIPSLVMSLFARSTSNGYTNRTRRVVRVLRMFKDCDYFNAITNDKTLAAEIDSRLQNKVTPSCLTWKNDAGFRIVQYDKGSPVIPSPDADALSDVHAFVLDFMRADGWEPMPLSDATSRLATFFKEE